MTVKEIIEALGEGAAYAFLIGKRVAPASYYDQGCIAFLYHLCVADTEQGFFIVTVPSDLPKHCLLGLYMNDRVDCDVLDLFDMGEP